MRLNARPLPVAENRSWRSSALALRWAKRAIRRLDWELRSGACEPLTALSSWRIAALAYKTERGRREGHRSPVSFVRKQGSRRAGSIGLRHNLRTILEHPPQRQVRTELESSTRRQRPVRREPSSI